MGIVLTSEKEWWVKSFLPIFLAHSCVDHGCCHHGPRHPRAFSLAASHLCAHLFLHSLLFQVLTKSSYRLRFFKVLWGQQEEESTASDLRHITNIPDGEDCEAPRNRAGDLTIITFLHQLPELLLPITVAWRVWLFISLCAGVTVTSHKGGPLALSEIVPMTAWRERCQPLHVSQLEKRQDWFTLWIILPASCSEFGYLYFQSALNLLFSYKICF